MEQFPGLPGWKRSLCLGCGDEVVAARDAYVKIGGRRDRTALLVIGLEPHIMMCEEPDAVYSGELVLFGVAHRACVERARRALHSGLVVLPPELPVVKGEEIERFPEEFHEPPTRRYCAFCGSENKLGHEHIWPQWVSRALKEKAGVGKSDRPFTTIGKRRRPSVLIDVTVLICTGCNTRWLANLEKDAQRVLGPMITGKARSLDRREQALTATWAAKMALMLDLYGGSEAIIPLGYYRDYEQRRAALPSMAVWMASYAGSSPAWARREALWVDISVTERPNAFVTTFVAGALVLQVAGHFAKSGSFYDDRRQFAQAIQVIWPVASDSVSWPPGLTALDHDALIAFAMSFQNGTSDRS